MLCDGRVATNLENLENSRNLKNCWKLREIGIFPKNVENSGKCEISDIITNENAFHWIFLCKVSQGQFWKLPENVRENSVILGSQRCGHPGWTSDSKQPLTHWALQRWRPFLLCIPELMRKHMNFGRPKTSSGVEDWKTYDVCGRHQELMS